MKIENKFINCFIYYIVLQSHIDRCLVFCHVEGHLKPFGYGIRSKVLDYEGFVHPVLFYKDFIMESRPILMKAAAKKFPAYSKWTDQHFLDMDLSNFDKKTVNVEQRKKENRSLATFNMNFQDFVKAYNHTDIYMVDGVPSFLIEDVSIPWSLQCQFWYNSFVDLLMWFSSGGTSSVVHTDEMENINCIIDGSKSFIFVDPQKHKGKIHFKKNGAYSDIDIDSVDFNKFPEVATIDYEIADLQAGDCIYIPKLWIHQVRSYGRNIAVNIWFDKPKHEMSSISLDKLKTECSNEFDLQKTFSNVELLGLENGPYSRDILEDIYEYFINGSTESLYKTILQIYPEFVHFSNNKLGNHVRSVINDIVMEFDANNNGVIEEEEIHMASKDTVLRIPRYVNYLKTLLESITLKQSDDHLQMVFSNQIEKTEL